MTPDVLHLSFAFLNRGHQIFSLCPLNISCPQLHLITIEDMETRGSKLNLPKYLLTKGKGSGKKPPITKIPMAPRDTNVTEPKGPSAPVMDAAATPANIKRKQVMRANQAINSPTDSFLSPCSQKLWKRQDVPTVARLNLLQEEDDDEDEAQSSGPTTSTTIADK